MSIDITPLVPQGRQLIQSYRGGTFLIAEVSYSGPVMVLPNHTTAWAVATIAALTIADFASLIEAKATEVLLLGCGARMELPPAKLRADLKAAGITIEPMDTGAACRTFNVLMSEDRRVAAALLPMP